MTYPSYQQPPLQQPQQPPLVFHFDGGAASYLGVGILSNLIIVVSFGILTPWAIAMRYRWVASHTLINGRRVEFTGSAANLFGHWIKWLLLCIVTFGIYSFWVAPRLWRWRIENQRISADPAA